MGHLHVMEDDFTPPERIWFIPQYNLSHTVAKSDRPDLPPMPIVCLSLRRDDNDKEPITVMFSALGLDDLCANLKAEGNAAVNCPHLNEEN